MRFARVRRWATTTMPDWSADPRPVPAELEPGFRAHEFGVPTRFDSVAYKLSEGNPDVFRALLEMSRGGVGEPSV